MGKVFIRIDLKGNIIDYTLTSVIMVALHLLDSLQSIPMKENMPMPVIYRVPN